MQNRQEQGLAFGNGANFMSRYGAPECTFSAIPEGSADKRILEGGTHPGAQRVSFHFESGRPALSGSRQRQGVDQGEGRHADRGLQPAASLVGGAGQEIDGALTRKEVGDSLPA